MTTSSERAIIFKLYTELNAKLAAAKATMQANCQQGCPVGYMDQDDYDNQERIRVENYRYGKGLADAWQTCWTLIKAQYSEWDISLALQEGEQRIGELPYVEVTR